MRGAPRLDRAVLIAALLTVPALILQQSSAGSLHAAGVALNWATWSVFAAEVIVKTRDDRRWFRTHPLEVVITVVTFPAVTGILAGARLLRSLRVLRVLRLGIFAKQLLSPAGLRYVAAFTALILFASGEAFAAVEPNVSAGNGLYWAVTTMTSVGYGDILPHTSAGKVIAVVVMFVGLGVAGIIAGAVVERFLHAARREEDHVLAEIQAVAARLENIEAHLGVAARENAS